LVASVVDEPDRDSDSDSASDDDDFTKALNGGSYKMATDGGEHMQTGRHYWEVEITSCYDEDVCDMLFGVVRSDHADCRPSQAACYMLRGEDGSLYGGSARLDHAHPSAGLQEGDTVGALLDLDAGWLYFYANGRRWGPGFASGVTGPLCRAVALSAVGDVVTARPGTETATPAGAGGASDVYRPFGSTT